MTPAATTSVNSPASRAVLFVQRSDGWQTSYTLEPGRSVMIGRSSNCGLQLVGEQLASIHCMVRMQEGDLLLQDWFSSTGTWINGEPVHGEVPVPAGATIQLGDYLVRAELRAGPSREPVASSTAPQSAPSPVAPSPPTINAGITGEWQQERSQLLEKIEAIEDENKMLRQQLQQFLDQPTAASEPIADPFAQETIDMLRAEVEQLQCELLHRQPAVAPQPVNSTDAASDITSGSTPQLIARMDELLSELEQSDGRIAALEDLLRVAEEASEAEREERRQLESWVNDIEKRIGDREADWKAEVDSLRNRLADATQQQHQMERRLAATASASQDDRLRVQAESWQARVAELEQQLAQSEQQQEELRQQLRQWQQQASVSGLSSQVDEALREERVRMAQERAELARARAEVAAMRAQLQQQANPAEPTGRDGDQRMRAFREHLREIHDLEQAEQVGRGLTARIAKLWKRLDG